VQVNAQVEQKQQLVNESYAPREMQLKALVLEATQAPSISNLAQQETAAQTGLDLGPGRDQEFSSHLQNEKAAINRQIEELDQALRRKQDELNEQMQMTQNDLGRGAGTQAQELLQGESQYQADGSGGQQGELLKELREKTQQVEELSLKIDELFQINNSMEGLVAKVHRFNQELYTATTAKLSSGQMSQAELRKQIAELNKQLEAFPRQNKNCIEYFEKYKLKYEELDSKFTQQQKTEDQISELLTSLREKKAKSIEDNFKLLSRNFTAIFRSIVPDGAAQLRLVKLARPGESQQTDPSQFPGTQGPQLTIGDSLYKGIRVLVSFSSQQALEGEAADQVISSQDDQAQQAAAHSLSLSHLSGGQKAVVAACLIFAIQRIEPLPFYILDEFDSALDPLYCEGIAAQIALLSRPHLDPVTGQQCPGSQFLVTSFKPHMVSCADRSFEVSFRNSESRLARISADKALKLIEKQGEPK